MFRYSVFLVVSLVAYFLPASPPPTTASDFVLPILERLTRDIDQLKDSVHVANLQRSTILRNPSLRAKLISFWTIAQREGEAVARDEELQRISRELQLHIDLVKDEDKPDTPIIVEGEQRQEARAFAEQSVEQLLRDLASAAQKS